MFWQIMKSLLRTKLIAKDLQIVDVPWENIALNWNYRRIHYHWNQILTFGHFI